MILGNKEYSQSPVSSQQYIWMAEYHDNTHLSEFDLETKESNSFYDIDKDKITRFGLIGNGSQAYFDIGNGIFNVNGRRIMISYATENQEYPLTGRTFLYNDIVSYKEAIAEANLSKKKGDVGGFNSSITSFNIGYKKRMELEGVDINFYNILSLPMNESAYFQIKISANKNLNGKLIIRVNGVIKEEIEAALVENMTGIINWNIVD